MKTIQEKLLGMGEYAVAGMYENTHLPRFCRVARGIRRYYEKCPLAPYTGKALYPSGVLPHDVSCRPQYLLGVEIRYQTIQAADAELADEIRADRWEYVSQVPKEHTVGGDMWTHSHPNYPRIVREGLDSYETRIRQMKDDNLREGLSDVLSGIRSYHARCLSYLREKQADERLLSALEEVPFRPARDLYEALVCWNFILYLDGCDNLGSLVTGLAPFYRGEDVTPVLENLFDNLNENDGFSVALHTDYSPLTLQCLTAVRGKRRPMVELFVNENTPDEIWHTAFASLRTGNGQPAFYSEKQLDLLEKAIPAIRSEDRYLFCGGGCTESMYTGLSNVGSLDAGINLLTVFERVMKEKMAACDRFELFYEAYIDAVYHTVDHVTNAIRRTQAERARCNPLPMRTLLIDDCIDREIEYNAGGARYSWSLVNFAGLINVVDAMLFLREHVYRKRDVSAETVLAECEANNADFLAFCRKSALHFGNDCPEANDFACRLSRDVYSSLAGKKTAFGEGFFPASIQFNSQALAGKGIGATPDGRAKGAPLCDSLGAVFGKDDRGPTALLRSVGALRLDLCIGTPVLNFNIEPNFSDEILKALVLGYQKLGGLQMQITCTDRKTLLEAYHKPDLHRNLVVRVGGYSEYFWRLSDELKRMVIDRTIQSLPED
ncbi:MAG: hypothetical protein MJ078_01795 [Clostridia bacterium]|nr:hypothetical protein [Clostridia bacterium]